MNLLCVLFVQVVLAALVHGNVSRADLDRKYKRGSTYASGPHMCPVEEVDLAQSKKLYMESPAETYQSPNEICGQKPRTFYECCAGYESYSGWPGCSRSNPLTNVAETLTLMEANKVSDVLKDTGMTSTFSTQGPYTVFAPIDEAFHEAEEDVMREAQRRDGIMYHVVNQKLSTDDLKHGQRLKMMSGGPDLYVSKEDKGNIMVNCARILRPNILAKNGMVHMLDRVLDRYPRRITDILWRDNRLSTFRDLISRSRLMEKLLRDEPNTILAPTNEAFKKLPKETMDRLLSNNELLNTVLQYHVLPGYVCSDSVTTQREYKTVEGSPMVLECKPGKGMTVGTAEMLKVDMTASNGVVHVVDEVQLPPNGNDIVARAEDLGTREFTKLLRETGLDKTLMMGGPYTLFAPTDSAFRALSRDARELLKDRYKLEEILKFHVVYGKKTTSDMLDNDQLNTLKVPDKLRVKLYRNGVSVEDGCIEKPNNMASNGVVHTINTLLLPPEQDMMEYIEKDNCLKEFGEALKRSGMASKLNEPGQFTLFAPGREAMRRSWKMDKAMRYPSPELNRLVDNHIVNDFYPTCNFLDGAFHPVAAASGKSLEVRKQRGQLMAGRASRAFRTNIMTKNGVIHVVDSVIDD